MDIENNDKKLMEYFKLIYEKQNKRNFDKIPIEVRNRRYKKLKELIDAGDYFSEESIKFRDVNLEIIEKKISYVLIKPILYFIYIGKYKREGNDGSSSFYGLLSQQMINKEYQKALNDAWAHTYNEDFPKEESFNEEIPLAELEDNEDEVIRIMHERFLSGLDDKFIDYDEIDINEQYDDLQEIAKDQEDLYFNEEKEEEEYFGETNTRVQDF